MNSEKEHFNRDDLACKNLLNISESRFYLNVSRQLFDHLEKCDPTFPKRKTPTKHSRPLLDAWLSQNGSLYFQYSKSITRSNRAVRVSLSLDQMN